MTQPDYHAGQGTPDQLPQGEATRLEQSTNVQAPAGVALPQPLTPTPTQPGTPFTPGNSTDEQILFGPTDGTTTWSPQIPQGRLPESVVRQLPLMRAAAEDPNAPESLRTIYQATVHTLENQLRG